MSTEHSHPDCPSRPPRERPSIVGGLVSVGDGSGKTQTVRSTRLLLCVTMGALIGLTDPVAARGSGRAEQCTSSVERVLKRAELSIADMTRPQWVVDQSGSNNDLSVWGYWFLGRPPGCNSGDVKITMSTTCRVREVETRGGCAVPGL